jgi:hypothetical protein
MTCQSGIVPRAKIKTIKMTFVFVTSKFQASSTVRQTMLRNNITS